MILHVPNILLPEANWKEWAVIACDQHTQDIDYWKRVEGFVGDVPSTLNLIYPEIYLPLDEKRVDDIHKSMRNYKNILIDHGPCFILVKRAVSGSERTGLVVAIDLEGYEYNGSDSFIRPTEKTIKERLPARVTIRENAELEITHVLVLYDDPEFYVLPRNTAGLAYEENKVYDFDLMEDGGHIKGFKISDKRRLEVISEKIQALGSLLVGDGNHSLAAAKSFWEKIKGTVPDNHPSRYALVELVNIHDPGLTFEPIHRLVRGVNPEELLKKFNARIVEIPSVNSFTSNLVEGNPSIAIDSPETDHSVGFITKDRRGILILTTPSMILRLKRLMRLLVIMWLNTNTILRSWKNSGKSLRASVSSYLH